MWKILVIWDVMLDKYSYWEVKRLNPEWPNPLLNIEKEEYRLWWSANVAGNIASLHWSCDLIWVIWKDQNAIIFENICKEKNINFLWIYSNFPTITKQRFIETTYEQQLLRVDYEDIIKLDELNKKDIFDLIQANEYDYILISDYNKWIISKKLVDFIKQLNIRILVDAKPKNIELFNNVFLIKPNFKEFCQITWKDIENNDKEIEKYWKIFVENYKTNLVITRGKNWASIITKDYKYYHIKTQAKDVFDVTWAGDTFIATIWYALLNWFDLVKAVELGNKASGIVIWKIWTEIINKNELYEW